MSRSAGLLLWLPLALLASGAAYAQDHPQTVPTRDVDITYRITRGGQTLQERTRWFAAQQMQRIDPPGNAMYMIMDHRTHHAAMVDDAQHTVLDMSASTQPGPLEAGSTAQFTRRGDDTVAGIACTNWQTSSGGADAVLCLTADGVLLRVQAAGNTLVEAVTVGYGRADPAAFAVPDGYQHVTPSK